MRFSEDTYGHEVPEFVPRIPGTKVKLCAACSKWFAARARENRCDGCVKPRVRAKRVASSSPEYLAETASRKWVRQALEARQNDDTETCLPS